MKNNLQKAYSILRKIPKDNQKEFMAKAIIFYQDYLDSLDEESFYSKEDVKHALYDLIKDNEVSPDFVKKAIYDLNNADKRKEEIDWYVDHIL